MNVTRALVTSFGIAAAGTALSAALLAQGTALDVKLGLWENTIVTNMGAGAPPVDTSKMSSEQAARIAETMKAMAGERTTTDKSCIKKEDLAKDSFLMPASANMTCTRTLITNTKTAYVADIACTGEQQLKGHVDIQASAGGTAFSGTMKMATSALGRSIDVSMKMSGKYLGADCGSIK